MRKLITAGLVALGMLTGAGAAVAVERGTSTADDVIVAVEGSAADGFGIHYHDGSAIYPPTDSEARAECNEYDTRRERVRCRTQVRTWYADLREMKRSLRWALAQ
jgi:hypothetical protein